MAHQLSQRHGTANSSQLSQWPNKRFLAAEKISEMGFAAFAERRRADAHQDLAQIHRPVGDGTPGGGGDFAKAGGAEIGKQGMGGIKIFDIGHGALSLLNLGYGRESLTRLRARGNAFTRAKPEQVESPATTICFNSKEIEHFA